MFLLRCIITSTHMPAKPINSFEKLFNYKETLLKNFSEYDLIINKMIQFLLYFLLKK